MIEKIPCITFFYYLGLLILIKKVINTLLWIRKSFFETYSDLKKKYGDGWVLITGGSEGIGYAFADKFLQLGFKVCILSRNKEKLQNAKDTLLKKYENAKIEWISYDLNRQYTEEDLNELNEKLKILNDDISIFLNNAGALTRKIYGDLTYDQIRAMVTINTIGLTYITKIVIGKMLKRKERSLIISSGSVAARMRIKTRSTYAATKFYLEAFSECLGREYGDKIDFTDLEIGPIDTALNRVYMPFKISSEELINSAIKYVGKYGFTTGNINHELFRKIFHDIPFVKEYYYFKGESFSS